MMTTIILVITAILSSSLLTTFANRWFDREQTGANTAKTEAEATNLLTEAWGRSLEMMAVQLEIAQKRILKLEEDLKKAYERIDHLEADRGGRRNDD